MNRIRSRFAMRPGVALTALMLSLLTVVAWGQQPPTKIVDIIVVGNKNINRESIIASSGLKVGDPVTAASLEEARRRLLQTGNFGSKNPSAPEESVKVSAENGDAGSKVVIEVDENDIVTGINLSGAGPVATADILKLMQTQVGRILNVNTLRNDVNAIQTYYKDKGYEGVVNDIGMTKGILDIQIAVGKISKIKINGLKKTRQSVVLREMQQKPGQYYNLFQLRKDFTNIYNTDLFESVDPALAYPTPGNIELTLNVQEKRTGIVGAGIGYSSRQSLVGRIEITETNFMGRGQQVSFLWMTGGTANRNSFEVGFTEPWLDRRHTSLSVNLFDKTVYRFGNVDSTLGGTTNNDTTYYETHTGGQITLSRPFGDRYRGFVGARYDSVRVPNLGSLNPSDQAILQNGPLAVLNLRATHNTRDFDQEPAGGGYDILSADLGVADLKPVQAGDDGVKGSYSKLSLDMRRYFSPRGRRTSPKDKRTVFALRLLAGGSTGKLPFSEQYFVGGAETLRGYREDRFWGQTMVLGSFEYRAPLANQLTGVLFGDVGDAWGGSYENVTVSGFNQHSGFSPSAGFGLGLRVVTPIGPIRIDQGFGREGARTHFSIGHVF